MKIRIKDNTRVFNIINNKVFTTKFIAGIAGDRLQSEEEKDLFERLILESGNDFYVKVLFHLTYEVFEKNHALSLWKNILLHKARLSDELNRDIAITVATLDYLTNIKDEIKDPKIIGEAFLGKIVEISSVDTLTKLYNRQHMTQALLIELNRYKRYKIPFSIMMIDVDHFKKVNDTYGHQTGDRLLIELSKLFIFHLRELDMCARYGGEEFIIVLPHTTTMEAFEIADRIRLKVEATYKEEMDITISIGISMMSGKIMNISELIKTADKALYQSKHNGRNMVSY